MELETRKIMIESGITYASVRCLNHIKFSIKYLPTDHKENEEINRLHTHLW